MNGPCARQALLDGIRGEDSGAFRETLSRFATGIAVVTVDGGQPASGMGMTINSFASVSLTPPLVLWSLNGQSSSYRTFADAMAFTIHVLGADQLEIARQYASKGGFAFRGDEPWLTDTLARFDCSVHARHPAGDHLIVLGQVTQFHCRDGLPLVYSARQYGSFIPQSSQ